MRTLAAIIAAAVLSAPALADLKVMDTEDVVRLVSGEEVRGTVIAVGIRAVIVIVEERERAIPRREVASIKRGEVRPTVKGYRTEAVDGIKVIVGEGFRDSELTGGEEEVAAGSEKPKAGRKRGKKRGKGGRSGIPQEKVDELMKDPKVRDMVNKLGGREKTMEMLEKNRNNPMVKRFMEQFLKSGKLPPGLEKFFK